MIGDILQPTHLLFILVIALLVLGPKRLPEVARSLGSGLRDFRSAISGEHSDDRDRGAAGSYQLFDEHGQRAAEAEHSYAAARQATLDQIEPSSPVEPADDHFGSPAAGEPHVQHQPAAGESAIRHRSTSEDATIQHQPAADHPTVQHLPAAGEHELAAGGAEPPVTDTTVEPDGPTRVADSITAAEPTAAEAPKAAGAATPEPPDSAAAERT